MPTLQPLEGTQNYYLWFYVPQIWASAIFLVAFTIPTGLHIWRMIKTRTWFCLAFVIGGIFELSGYALRAIAYNNTGMILPYAFFAMATLLAPALFAASIYMTLSRLLHSSGLQAVLFIRKKWLTSVFVGGDVVSFVVQGGGCGLMVMRDMRLARIGEDIVVAGLAIQIIMLAFFIAITVIPHRSLRQASGHKRTEQGFLMLYAVSILILVRSIFRLIEFIQGREGYLLQNEWPTLVFDGALMAITMVVFFFLHPSSFISPSAEDDIRLDSALEPITVKDGPKDS
ncbi:RTA1 like protein-domain-containing protein [Stachybotrys elegans]|uniref:RTA1 like protein-domain-containing protein n=1 Tax=Stachybotrys elegans TaxID=80388 RepID=A0A8K0SWL5_9HYPO|nr:RTA1 like protein-domain-containing protein [Stachybotrys elegans]